MYLTSFDDDDEKNIGQLHNFINTSLFKRFRNFALFWFEVELNGNFLIVEYFT